MEQRKIPLVDRLKDRGFVDQWGFAAFAVAGSLGIVAAKHLDVSATRVAIGAVAVMALYALLIARSGSGRLRSDQAGDNCYYLGLIFTLSSLAYAIFFFDPANTATTIIQGFGIALATTIAGLVLRVFFNQGRPDLENVEELARLELTHAAASLKTELGQVVRNMNDFSRQVRQSMSETHEAATADIQTFTSTAIGGLQQVIDTARDSLQTEASDFAKRTKRYSAAVDSLMGALERHGENLDKLNEAQDAMAGSLAAIRTSTEANQAASSLLEAQARDIGSSLAALREGSDAIGSTVRQLSEVIGQMDRSIGSLGREIESQIAELKAGPSEAAAEASRALQDASATLRRELESVSAIHRSTAEAIETQASGLLEATRTHNQGLGAELSRSGELLASIQRNLTDMTGVLVDKVRERP